LSHREGLSAHVGRANSVKNIHSHATRERPVVSYRKCTRLEIHTLTPSGLEARLDVPIYGRISALKLFKPKTKSQSMLFLLTERYKFCVLEYNNEGKLVTVANGDVEDTIGRPAECGHLCVIDEEATMIGLHMYDGHLKIIPIDEDGAISEQAFNVRLDELKVIDLAFVGKGTLGVLHEDTKGARHLKTCKVSKGGVLQECAMKVANVDGGMVLGLGGDGDDDDGCLVVGKQVRGLSVRWSRPGLVVVGGKVRRTADPSLSERYCSMIYELI
jgi:DNA damage-binding protein 1